MFKCILLSFLQRIAGEIEELSFVMIKLEKIIETLNVIHIFRV